MRCLKNRPVGDPIGERVGDSRDSELPFGSGLGGPVGISRFEPIAGTESPPHSAAADDLESLEAVDLDRDGDLEVLSVLEGRTP